MEDLEHILLPMFEAVIFLHDHDTAHQDIDQENFLLEWAPESRLHRFSKIPRVFLIDFESAALLSESSEDRFVPYHPLGERYNPERLSPEARTGNPYCPFKLDVWQLGRTCESLKDIAPGFDVLLSHMTHPDPQERPTAAQSLSLASLYDVLNNQPPVH